MEADFTFKGIAVLVLSRKPGERIIVGNGEIVLTVVEIRSDGKVRIGIEADKDTPIHREEVYEAIRRSKQEQPQETLAQWLEAWEAARESGQSSITREEAELRYYKKYGRDDKHQNGEG